MEKMMEKTRVWIKAFALLVVGIVLVACGNSEAADGEEITNIGILLSADHSALTSAQEGFIEGLEENGFSDGENVQINILNAQGNSSNLHDMAKQLADENDLLLGITTSAAQALASASGGDTPILFTATTDPENAGLVETMEAPGGNITGTSDMVPFEEQIALLHSIKPEAEKIGIIFNSSEPNSQIQADLAVEEIKNSGREAIIKTVTSTNDVQQVATSLMNEVDAVYIPTDNTLSSAATTVGELAIEHQIPIVAGSIDHTAEGGLATYGIDYHSLGKQTGQMAIDILKNNTNPANMPVETAQELNLFVNEEMADALGIDPASIQLEE